MHKGESQQLTEKHRGSIGERDGAEPGQNVSYGPSWAHYLGGYQDRLLSRPLGLPGLGCTTPVGV
jgi:hypothetical protein